MNKLHFVIRPILFTAIISIMTKSGYAQKYAVKNPYNNSIYIGMETPLEAFVEGIPCKLITLKATTGRITKEACNFSYFSNKLGIDTISILANINRGVKSIGVVYINIKLIPDPEAYVGGINKGSIGLNFLKAQPGLSASVIMTPYGHKENVIVDSFSIIILRNNDITFSGTNTGSIFTHLVRTAFDSLQKGDKVMIANITVRNSNSTSIVVRPIELVLD